MAVMASELAAIAQISPNYFAVQFKQVTDLSLNQYLILYWAIEKPVAFLECRRLYAFTTN
jgi:hypothetical protein